MQKIRFLAAASAVALFGCGGGDGASSPPPTSGPAPTPPSTPTLAVTLSETSANVTVEEGGSATFGFDASYTGSSSSPIVADVQVGGRRYVLDGAPTQSGSSFRVDLKTVPFPAGGQSSTEVNFRLCTTAACSTVYPGSQKAFTVNLDVQLGGWTTLQRNAAHDGYVKVRYDVADFEDAWSVTTINPTSVSADRGVVFFNSPAADFRSASTYALNSSDGSEKWRYSLGSVNSRSGPATYLDKVVSMAMASSSSMVPLQFINAVTGAAAGTASYASQFSNGGVPTPFGSQVYFQAGYYGNVVYAADINSPQTTWSTDTTRPDEGYVQEGASVAVDEGTVYFFGGGNLFMLDRNNGGITSSIRNPYFSSFGLSYFGTYAGGPMLGGDEQVFTFSDNRDLNTPLPILAFRPATGQLDWRTSRTYVGHPALKETTLFAIREDGYGIDLINTSNGAVQKSIDIPVSDGRLSYNLIVTENYLFASTENKTIVFDLEGDTITQVWSAPVGGNLAITPDNKLIVSQDITFSTDDRVVAFKLF